MKLSILVPSVPERISLRSRLLHGITQQPGINDTFEVLVHHSKSEHGDKIDTMVRYALGTHVVIVDDDDWLADDYASTVLPLISDDVDFVGYKILSMVDGRYSAIYIHDAQYTGWQGSFRGVCQKMPIRKELVVPYGGAGGYWYHRDWEWAAKVQENVKTWTYVDRELYFHDFWNAPNRARSVGPWPFDHALVRWM